MGVERQGREEAIIKDKKHGSSLRCYACRPKDAKTIFWVTPSYGIIQSCEMPSEEIRKNQKEMLGFEWSDYKEFYKDE